MQIILMNKETEYRGKNSPNESWGWILEGRIASTFFFSLYSSGEKLPSGRGMWPEVLGSDKY